MRFLVWRRGGVRGTSNFLGLIGDVKTSSGSKALWVGVIKSFSCWNSCFCVCVCVCVCECVNVCV